MWHVFTLRKSPCEPQQRGRSKISSVFLQCQMEKHTRMKASGELSHDQLQREEKCELWTQTVCRSQVFTARNYGLMLDISSEISGPKFGSSHRHFLALWHQFSHVNNRDWGIMVAPKSQSSCPRLLLCVPHALVEISHSSGFSSGPCIVLAKHVPCLIWCQGYADSSYLFLQSRF